jgi:hypothetical protein
MLDKRTASIVWPHYIEPLHYRGASFWKKPSRMWKSRRKYRLLLFFLPVLLRDQVPRLRKAVVLLASALRRLDGQVYSYERAKEIGILPGLRALKDDIIDSIHRDLVIALCYSKEVPPWETLYRRHTTLYTMPYTQGRTASSALTG